MPDEIIQTTETKTDASAQAAPTEQKTSVQDSTTTDQKAPEIPSWATNRIDALSRQKKESIEENARLKARIAELEKGNNTPQIQIDPAEIERIADAKAAERLFAAECSKIFESGKTEFPDFEKSLDTFKTLGGLPRQVVEAAIEVGNAHKVLYQLTRDPEEAYRIIQLKPAAQAAALAKIALGGALRQTSSAPPPVMVKVGSGSGSGEPDINDPNVSMADYTRIRANQIKQRNEAKRQIRR